MKIRLWNSKTLILPAVWLIIGLAGSVRAADFFPLDVWEEMVARQSKKSDSAAFGPEAYHAPRSSVLKTAGKAPDAFPWDVRAELQALGSGTRYNASGYLVTIDTASRNGANPYWQPEELRWDPLPAADPVNVADYLTDFR